MPSEISTLIDLFGRVEFITGVAIGAASLIVLIVLPSPAKRYGIVLAAASVLGINLSFARRLGMTLGILLLIAGGIWLDREEKRHADGPRYPPGPWAVLATGALVVTVRGGLEGIAWLQIASPLVILVAGYHLRWWLKSKLAPLVGVLVLITAAGIWSTVPETDTARVLLGASACLAVSTVTPVRARLTTPGSFALAGVIGWIASTGGAGREASIVGAWACLGVLLLFPVLNGKLRHLNSWAVVGVHIVLALIASRVIGLWDDALPAVLAVSVVAFAAFWLMRNPVGRPVSQGPS